MRLVYLSTLSMLLTIVCLPLLYVFDPPLTFEDLLRITQQIIPVFVGFLVSAVAYAFSTKRDITIAPDRYAIVSYILSFSFAIYWIGLLAVGGMFLWSHGRYAAVGSGMSKDVLFAMLTICVSIVTGVTGLISTNIFFEKSDGDAGVS